MDERSTRIVQTAIRLAEEGGYEAVRLRDVANRAHVALGTLYKRFRSKEDMLIAALSLEFARVDDLQHNQPPQGDTPIDRVVSLFDEITDVMMRRPKFSRAVIRAVASGDPQMADKVLRFRSRTVDLIVVALQGDDHPLSKEDANVVAELLQRLWFAAVVGWMGGLHDASEITAHVRQGARLILAGVGALAVDDG